MVVKWLNFKKSQPIQTKLPHSVMKWDLTMNHHCFTKRSDGFFSVKFWQDNFVKRSISSYQIGCGAWGFYGLLWCKHPMKEVIATHLRSLLESLDRYFPKDDMPERHIRIRQPFTTSNAEHQSTQLEDSLLDFSSQITGSFHSQHSGGVLAVSGYQKLPWKFYFLLVLHKFCEKTISALTYLKNKYRSRLIIVEDDLHFAVFNILPRIQMLCIDKQANRLH